MIKTLRSTAAIVTTLCALAIAAPLAQAQPWTSFDDNTRYLALGDSLSASYGAKPVTQGFVYQLYQGGVIDNINNLLLCSLGVPNATTVEVGQYQVPQAGLCFAETGTTYRKVVTLTVGGNDLIAIGLGQTTLPAYANRLGLILTALVTQFPDAKIYVANLYDPRLPIPGLSLLVDAMNQAIAGVVALVPPGHVFLVDLHTAFDGRSGLLLSEKHGAEVNQVHPTDAGYKVIAKAFEDVIRAN
jgi:lysophospholipase L1-like esterase